MLYYGHFYQMEGRNCRSTLEIVRDADAPDDPNDLLVRQPDVVCVMMNPGASTPTDQVHDPGNQIDAEDPQHIMCDGDSHLVVTDPDRTQHKIEDMMNCRNLSHVRVLNLFDIRQTISNEFLREIGNMSGNLRAAYSIFSPDREHECLARINPEMNIVVAAWGVDGRLQEYATRCANLVNSIGLRIHGYRKELYYHPYYHPYRRNDWLPYILQNWPI